MVLPSSIDLRVVLSDLPIRDGNSLANMIRKETGHFQTFLSGMETASSYNPIAIIIDFQTFLSGMETLDARAA